MLYDLIFQYFGNEMERFKLLKDWWFLESRVVWNKQNIGELEDSRIFLYGKYL